jgi:hypothetical protein
MNPVTSVHLSWLLTDDLCESAWTEQTVNNPNAYAVIIPYINFESKGHIYFSGVGCVGGGIGERNSW